MSEKMIFCLGDGKYERKGEGYQKNLRIFNQEVTEDEFNTTWKLLKENEIKISLTKWVEEKDMTDEDKKNYSNYKTLGGCLKVFSYHEAWKHFWDGARKKQKQTVLNLPNFDADIFKEITGIDIKKKKEDTQIDELIKIDELINSFEELLKKAEGLIKKDEELLKRTEELSKKADELLKK